MNAHGVKVEQDGGKPIMSSLHAGWAFGGMAGAALAALGAAAGLDGRLRVLIASLLLLAAVTFLTRRLGEGSRAEGDEAAGFRLPSRSVVLLATLCLLVMVTEGAMADWGGLYLRQNLESSAAIAALAYSFFTGGMTVGRVFGDAVNRRIGPVALLRWGAVLTALPLAAFLLIGQVPVALVRLLRRRRRRGERRAADVQRRRAPARRGAGAGDRRGLLDGLARLPRRAADLRLPRGSVLAPLGAQPARARRRRRLRARPARGRGAPARARAARGGPGRVKFAAVISDLDGTLVDSMAPTTRAWARWGARHGLDGAALQAANHGRPARDVLAEMFPAAELEAEAAWLLDAEVSDTDGVVALPGAAGVLDLPAVAIATSCFAPLALARIRAAGLRVPEVLVTGDETARGKPAPEPFLLAAERLGADPADCLVLEDAPAGVAAARAAGMTVWAVTTTHPAAELDGAERISAHVGDLLAALPAPA